MTTLLVHGGLLVDEAQVRAADVLVDESRVRAVLPPGHGTHADQTLDAQGLHVLPGLVDAHVHFNEPGRTDWEGFLTGTAAAAAGGVTTVCDMPLNAHPPTLDRRALTLKLAAVRAHAYVDYALWGGVVPASLQHLEELKSAGVVGVKAFMCDSGLAEFPAVDEWTLVDVMEECARLDLLLALHAEDDHVVRTHTEALRASGRTDPAAWARSRAPTAELGAVYSALRIAREAGARVHFVHVSVAHALEVIASYGIDATAETCPHYLALDESDLEALGAIAKCAPPLRSPEMRAQLWQCVLNVQVDYIASDHSPCPPAMKDTGDIWSAWGGISGVQTTLPVLLSLGLPLPTLVRLTCANPARRLGLYPRKGALQPGSDADLVLLRPDVEWTPREEDLLTRWKVSPFLGRTLKGKVVATLVRGVPIYRDGHIVAEPGYGRRV